MEKKEYIWERRRVVGIDVGSRNLSYCLVESNMIPIQGLLNVTYIPSYPLDWGLVDLKPEGERNGELEKRRFYYDGVTRGELPPGPQPLEKFENSISTWHALDNDNTCRHTKEKDIWSHNISRWFSRENCPALYEPYKFGTGENDFELPAVVIENQMAEDMSEIADRVSQTIINNDREAGLYTKFPPRASTHRAKKLGLRNDKSFDYDERKDESVRLTRSDLESFRPFTEKALKAFNAWWQEHERRKTTTDKLDDLSDSYRIAHTMIYEIWRNLGKNASLLCSAPPSSYPKKKEEIYETVGSRGSNPIRGWRNWGGANNKNKKQRLK